MDKMFITLLFTLQVYQRKCENQEKRDKLFNFIMKIKNLVWTRQNSDFKFFKNGVGGENMFVLRKYVLKKFGFPYFDIFHLSQNFIERCIQ